MRIQKQSLRVLQVFPILCPLGGIGLDVQVNALEVIPTADKAFAAIPWGGPTPTRMHRIWLYTRADTAPL